MTYSQALAIAMQHWGPSWCEMMTIKLSASPTAGFYCSIRPPVRMPAQRRN